MWVMGTRYWASARSYQVRLPREKRRLSPEKKRHGVHPAGGNLEDVTGRHKGPCDERLCEGERERLDAKISASRLAMASRAGLSEDAEHSI